MSEKRTQKTAFVSYNALVVGQMRSPHGVSLSERIGPELVHLVEVPFLFNAS